MINITTISRHVLIPILVFLVAISLSSCGPQAVQPEGQAEISDPLPSWNNGIAKQSILDFVSETTDPESGTFIPLSERIVVFDNDGTLWSEQPYYFQLQFAIDRIRQLAPGHPEWKNQQPFKAVLEDDITAIMESGVPGLLQLVIASHTGMNAMEFKAIVRDWISTARHPKTGKLYREMVYQPMLEVLDHLRENGFKTYIVSGGGTDFIRPWAEDVYGVPPEQVIGSTIKTEFTMVDGNPEIIRLGEISVINDKEAKPLEIEKIIGKRPVAAFGNSDGDLQMLQWTAAGEGKRLLVYIHHTDAEREWAYDRDSHVGKFDKGLDEAAARTWTVVDMKKDWKFIYPEP